MVRKHGENGRFIQAGNEKRKVRTIRATDSTWQKIQELAESQNLSVGDLIESIANEDSKSSLPPLDYKNIRAKTLSKFKSQERIGEQSAKYKYAKKVLDIFVSLISPNAK